MRERRQRVRLRVADWLEAGELIRAVTALTGARAVGAALLREAGRTGTVCQPVIPDDTHSNAIPGDIGTHTCRSESTRTSTRNAKFVDMADLNTIKMHRASTP